MQPDGLAVFELREAPPPRTAAQFQAAERMAARAAARGWTFGEMDLDQRAELAAEIMAEDTTPEQRARWKGARPEPEKWLAYLVLQTGAPTPFVVRQCAICGEEFSTALYVPGRRGRPARYCSGACKQLAYRSRHPLPPPKPKAPPKPLTCACCGGHFDRPAAGRPGRFCSRACKAAAYRRRQLGLPERMSRAGDARALGRWRR